MSKRRASVTECVAEAFEVDIEFADVDHVAHVEPAFRNVGVIIGL